MGWGVRCRCPRHQPPPAPPEVQTFFPGGRQSKHAPAQVAPALLFPGPAPWGGRQPSGGGGEGSRRGPSAGRQAGGLCTHRTHLSAGLQRQEGNWAERLWEPRDRGQASRGRRGAGCREGGAGSPTRQVATAPGTLTPACSAPPPSNGDSSP